MSFYFKEKKMDAIKEGKKVDICQGDVFFVKINNLPEKIELKRIYRKQRGFILAEGETTGHAHVIDDDVDLFTDDNYLYLQTEKPVVLKHEEHNPLTIEPGLWLIGIQKEVDIFEEEIRRVQD